MDLLESVEALKGIGPRTAAKIVARYGEQSLEILEHDPERLTEISGSDYFRCGVLTEPLTAWAYADRLKELLRTDVRIMGPGNAEIRKVGLSSGGGSPMWERAAETGCDAFISGEIKHHLALAMADRGIVGFECGHFATEEPGIRALAFALQKQLNQVECNLRIYVSGVSAYSFPRQP